MLPFPVQLKKLVYQERPSNREVGVLFPGFRDFLHNNIKVISVKVYNLMQQEVGQEKMNLEPA